MVSSPRTRLTQEQITAMCRRAYGQGIHIESVQALGGGTFNETYLVGLAGAIRVVLRAAPPPTPDVFWDDVALMRREHHIRPFFASIAPFIPQVIMADFTHQIVERDYLFQELIEGQRWSDIEDELTSDEQSDLWYQCGIIVQHIHQTTGDRFGYPYPGCHFTRWSEAVLDRLARIGESMRVCQLEMAAFTTVSDIARGNVSCLDEIRTPRLLHGDLWTFNLLVTRGDDGPTITGVLDADRAWWGDPMADWIMFLWAIRQDRAEWRQRLAAFQRGYGTPDRSGAAEFRQAIYEAMHLGLMAVWSSKNGDGEGVARARRDLNATAHTLSH